MLGQAVISFSGEVFLFVYIVFFSYLDLHCLLLSAMGEQIEQCIESLSGHLMHSAASEGVFIDGAGF
jgi:hypothetical protein